MIALDFYWIPLFLSALIQLVIKISWVHVYFLSIVKMFGIKIKQLLVRVSILTFSVWRRVDAWNRCRGEVVKESTGVLKMNFVATSCKRIPEGGNVRGQKVSLSFVYIYLSTNTLAWRMPKYVGSLNCINIQIIIIIIFRRVFPTSFNRQFLTRMWSL